MGQESSENKEREGLFLIPREVPIFILKNFLETIYKIQITGLENIPKKGGAIIICNHTDYLDVLIQGVYSPRKIVFLGKNELFEPHKQVMDVLKNITKPLQDSPLDILTTFIRETMNSIGDLYGKQLMFWGAIPIVRNYHGNDAKSAVKYYEDLENYMIDILKKGEILSVYPEGTRTKDGSMAPFKALTAKIAIRANVPIIPSGISGAWNMSKPEAFISGQAFGAKIQYNIGKSINPSEFPDLPLKKASKDLTEKLEKRVKALIDLKS